MNLEKQKENIANLLKLIQENPDVEILPMVDSDIIYDEGFRYWTAKWGSAKVTKYLIDDVRIHEYDDLEDLVDEWVDNNYEDYKDLSDDELFDLAEDRKSMSDRVDGLTKEEGKVMDNLIEAWNTFATLERQHPGELKDFADGIHRCQYLLAVRIARREYPNGWPMK